MREILFRGKRTDNGEWIYGYVNQHRGESILDCMCEQINSDDFYIYDYAAKIDTGIYGLLYKIIPETRGEFTGLTDKSGKKIFEGDIIRVEHDLWHGETKKTRESHIGVVFYNTKTAEFGAKIHGYSSCLRLRRWKGDFNEVIGNIHDNPELLEGGDNNET